MIGILSLPQNIQDEISKNNVSMGHARVLSKLSDESQQQELLNKILKDGISVRELENLTQSPTVVKVHQQKRKEVNNEYAYLQEELSEKLGTKVVIKKNKIEIKFVNNNDLNRLLECMNIEVEK